MYFAYMEKCKCMTGNFKNIKAWTYKNIMFKTRHAFGSVFILWSLLQIQLCIHANTVQLQLSHLLHILIIQVKCTHVKLFKLFFSDSIQNSRGVRQSCCSFWGLQPILKPGVIIQKPLPQPPRLFNPAQKKCSLMSWLDFLKYKHMIVWLVVVYSLQFNMLNIRIWLASSASVYIHIFIYISNILDCSFRTVGQIFYISISIMYD